MDTYKEKYEAALERAKKTLESSSANEIAKTVVYYFFPELAESEDERLRKGIIEIIKAVSGPDCDVYLDEKKQEKYIAWLEKQKEQKPWKVGANAYFTPEQKPEEVDESTKRLNDNWMKQHFDDYEEQKPAWSEEDEEMLEEIINHIDTTSVQRIPARPGSAIGKSWIKFLKSLRPQPKQEWSEEDERMLSRCIKSIETSKQFADSGTFKEAKDKEITWLKSLRPSWKPSEEQMEALKCAVEDVAEFSKRGGRQVELENEPYYSALHSLYCNLEKLM